MKYCSMERNLTMAVYTMELENFIVVRDNKIEGFIGKNCDLF